MVSAVKGTVNFGVVRAKSAVLVILTIPVMAWLLGQAGVRKMLGYGLLRTFLVFMAGWVVVGCAAVLLTRPDHQGAYLMWQYPESVCRYAAPGAWPITKVVLKTTGCSSWALDAMARGVGWDWANEHIRMSYGSMTGGLLAGALNRDYFLQGLLLAALVPIALIYLPIAGLISGFSRT